MNDKDENDLHRKICFRCQEKDTYWAYQCSKCGKGLCNPCGKMIYNEMNERIKSKSCEYCTKDLDKFCQGCKDHLNMIVENERNHCAKPSKMLLKQEFAFDLFDDNRCSNISYIERTPETHPNDYIEYKYKSPYIDEKGEITVQSVSKGLNIDWCNCDKRCQCVINATKEVKREYQLTDFTLREIYDEIIDYSICVCDDCNPKENMQIGVIII
jgi:hypothetical protein